MFRSSFDKALPHPFYHFPHIPPQAFHLAIDTCSATVNLLFIELTAKVIKVIFVSDGEIKEDFCLGFDIKSVEVWFGGLCHYEIA